MLLLGGTKTTRSRRLCRSQVSRAASIWLRPSVAGRLRISVGFSQAYQTGIHPTDAWNRLAEFRDLLPLELPTDGNLARARDLHLTRGVSLWDALIIAACAEAGVDTFVNPFT